MNLFVLLCLISNVVAQFSGSSLNIPAILDAQARIVEAYYGNKGQQSSSGPRRTDNNYNTGYQPSSNNDYYQNIPAIVNAQARIAEAYYGNKGHQPSSSINLGSIPGISSNLVNPFGPGFPFNQQNNNPNYVVNPQNTRTQASRRPSFQYPDIKNSLNNANSALKNIGSPEIGAGGLSFPFLSFLGR
ncbi:hypothetical protein ACKWTF_004520 [Chironomus riparius]